jgi:ribosomal-protein-alanine N-acetyltransferase
LYLEVRASNADAQRLYERLGFNVVGRRAGYYRQPREDAIAMGVELPLER